MAVCFIHFFQKSDNSVELGSYLAFTVPMMIKQEARENNGSSRETNNDENATVRVEELIDKELEAN